MPSGTFHLDLQGHTIVGIRKSIVVGATALAVVSGAVTASGPALGAVTSTTGTTDVTGAYYKVTTQRVLDTRSGQGVSRGQLGAGRTLSLKVTGTAGIPAGGVSAVVLNLTVTNPTAASYLVAYPHDSARPNVSAINFPRGFTGANLVTVPIGASGTVDVFNAAGSVDVIADAIGFYAADNSPSATLGPSGGYVGVVPMRVFDSRSDPSTGGQIVPFSDQSFVTLPVDFGPTVNPHVTGLVVNVTADGESSGGFVRAWDGGTEPTTSTVNFSPGKTVANTAIVPSLTCTVDPGCAGFPSIRLKVFTPGTTHLIVDLVGIMLDGTVVDPTDPTYSLDWRYKPVATPQRIVDTRTGLGGSTRLGPMADRIVTAPSGVAGPETAALVTNVTAVSPSAATWFVLWANGDAKPGISNINSSPSSIVANAAFVTVGSQNDFHLSNAAGTADALLDVAGTFEYHLTSTAGLSKALTAPAAPAPARTPSGVTATRGS